MTMFSGYARIVKGICRLWKYTCLKNLWLRILYVCVAQNGSKGLCFFFFFCFLFGFYLAFISFFVFVFFVYDCISTSGPVHFVFTK